MISYCTKCEEWKESPCFSKCKTSGNGLRYWCKVCEAAYRKKHYCKPIEKQIQSYFPYQFTGDQEKAIQQVREGLASGRVLNLLIHGEVSSGKSAIMFYATIGCALQGHRAAIIAPTSILAQQHCDNLKGLGWSDLQLTTKSGQDDGSSITIGTHAIFNDDSILSSAALVCCDEVQKFGVQQRAAIYKSSHLLILSATPIPRSLAMTIFGDLGVATLRELPIKRGTVVTRWVLPDRREAMYEIIEKELVKGHQAYFVYPRISGDENVVCAKAGLREWTRRCDSGDTELDGSDVALLTGKTSAEDKKDIFRQFKVGHIRVLISTVIAEVGLDNPNATVMVVEGADRFGLSQLHQLRGRVCRSTDTVFCFLVSETSNPTSIARLEVIEKCNDGFEIAEADLRLRGAGEVFSTRQTGLPALRWCSLVDDFDLMIEAKETVQAGSVGSGVREMMVLKYGDSLELGRVV